VVSESRLPVDVRIVGLAPDLVDYVAAWHLQRDIHADVLAGRRGDTVLVLEHTPVYTAGKRTNSWDRPSPGSTTTPVIDVDRGGKITWHGPGQLVGYPIVRLADPVDVVAHVRRLEQLLMDVCSTVGLPTVRVDGRSGVWVPADDHGPDRKVAAIGVRVARGVTMHGFALNCDNDLGPFHSIVPCGIDDAGVTTLTAELGRDVTVREMLPLVRERLDALVAIPAT
jgi:lipoyl(octanoyl) transferase